MVIVKQIGRYEIPITDIQLIAKTNAGYEITLRGGVKFNISEDEKRELDNARAFHSEVVRVYGMCRGLGLRT